MKFRNLLNISLFTLSLIAVFSACCKDDGTVTPTNEEAVFSPNNGLQQVATSRSDEDEDLCFELGFPISIQLPNGSSASANNMDEIEAIYENWIAQNPGDTTCPAVVYPITVILEDGTSHSVYSDDELLTLLEDCFEEEIGWEDCFTIQYPVTIQFPDGSSATADSDLQLTQLFDGWYNAHPNSMEDPTIAYPINVTLADGTTQSIGSDEEIEQIFEDCYGEWEDTTFMECFEFVYPLQVALPDGTVQSASSNEDLDAIYMGWMEANPNSEDFPSLLFPLQVVVLENGETVTLNNEVELSAVLENCYGDIDFDPCFTYNYPLTLVMPDGSTPTVNSNDEFGGTLEAWFEANPNTDAYITFQFPISVTLTEDGSVVTVNSEEELSALYETCYGCLVDGSGFAIAQQQNKATEVVVKRHKEVKKQVKSRISKAVSGNMKPQAK